MLPVSTFHAIKKSVALKRGPNKVCVTILVPQLGELHYCSLTVCKDPRHFNVGFSRMDKTLAFSSAGHCKLLCRPNESPFSKGVVTSKKQNILRIRELFPI